MTSLFFLGGCAFAYYIAFPRAANFLLGVAAGGNLRPLVTADEYFDLIIMIMLGLGVVFEIPTVTFVGSRLGLISPGFLLKAWRYALIGIFLTAELLSPNTDVPNCCVRCSMLCCSTDVGMPGVSSKRQTERSFKHWNARMRQLKF